MDQPEARGSGNMYIDESWGSRYSCNHHLQLTSIGEPSISYTQATVQHTLQMPVKAICYYFTAGVNEWEETFSGLM